MTAAAGTLQRKGLIKYSRGRIGIIDACRGVAECESPFECGLEVIRLTEAAWKSMDNHGAPAAVTD